MGRGRKQEVLRAMTQEEQDFAEQHHNLIYWHLNRRKLSIDEYYSLAAIGYVLAVMKYHRQERLRNYAFSTIANNLMDSHIKAEWCKNEIKCQSLNRKLSEQEPAEFMEFLADSRDRISERIEQIRYRELLEAISRELSQEEREQLSRRLLGDHISEIRNRLGISQYRYTQNRLRIEAVSRKVLGYEKKQEKYLPEARKRIEKRRKEGKTYQKIANEVGYSSSYVAAICQKTGVRKPSYDQQRIINLWKEGKKQWEIAREIGCSVSYVYCVCKRM